MPRFPIFRLGKEPDQLALPEMIAAAPSIALEGLAVGVDNLRHDVALSPRFVEAARAQVMRLIVRHGELEGLLAAEAPQKTLGPSWMRNAAAGLTRNPAEKSDWKPLLAELHLAALNRAKKEENISVDLLARLAVIKFLRTEMNQQFAQVLERCRVLLKNYEGIRQGKAVEYRESVAAFQVRKKIILRRTGQDLFETLREIEKETLARMRRSLFGEAKTGEAKTGEAKTGEVKSGEPGSAGLGSYGLFLNRLAFSEDGRDDYLCAEHYVMMGNWDRDPDRYPSLKDIVWGFIRSLFGEETTPETIDAWLCAPGNSRALVGTGTPDDSTVEGVAQQNRLAKWVRLLEDQQVMECVIASYHTVPLLSEYAPRINPQQLKNALISRPECDRVERMIQEHGKLSPNSLYAAVGKVAGCRGTERSKIAARFLQDFSQYHRDLRRLETLNAALDSVNVVSTEKLRELSRMNGTLYEFLLPEEQQPEEERVLRHVVLKADVRDSTRLTRTLMEKGLNPASYFSLNFYHPVNKLLGKYGAQKVFLEGDAIILAILERSGEPELAVSRACVLAREIIEIVRGYNELMQRSGMPGLELGVGIALQEAAPLYLMDGEHQIMISEALNESDRLSSCNKRARRVIESQAGPFHVFVFQTADAGPTKDEAENPEDSVLSYNLGGIRMNEAAFRKLEQEVSLVPLSVKLPPSIAMSDKAEYQLFSATVPVDRDIFRKIVVRQSRVPRIHVEDFSVQGWTDRTYYEVCTDPAIYAALEKKKAAKV
jgi:hemoglobin-like flavoprotein